MIILNIMRRACFYKNTNKHENNNMQVPSNSLKSKYLLIKSCITLLILILLKYNTLWGQINITENSLTVLEKPADSMMRNYLTGIVDSQFAARERHLATLKTIDDWDGWIHTIKDSIASWTGPLPERTPLNARITGKIDRGDYTIEKVLFESRPNYYVSGCLYLPKNKNTRSPAQLNVIGHAADGKANERYQRMSIAQVRNGFVVFTIDQLGQGERKVKEYESRGSAPGNAHRIIGIQSFISGTHIFNIMVWDAIRAIDYLVSRPEVDETKICMTGSSGGGMMTTYILPLDNRIAVAVPVCNPNTWSYRVHANLATDHEQVFFGAFESNIDPRGDLLFTHVPKPLLINATTDDNLNPPRGVWDLSNWLFKLYSAYGAPEKFTTSMVRAAHDYNQVQREVTSSWMLRWTGNNSAKMWEKDAFLEREEDLFAALKGNVFNEPGSRSDHDLVLEYLNKNKARWGEVKTAKAVGELKKELSTRITKLLNTNFDNIHTTGHFKDTGNFDGITIKKFILEPEAGILLPGFILEPEKNASNQKVVLYLNDQGKEKILKDINIVKELLNNGYRICAVDLRGIGETSPDMAEKFWDFLAGKPIFGQRVRDVLSTIQWLKDSEVKAQRIKLWGTGMCALYGSFAGVLNDDIAGFVFEEPLVSFESLVRVDTPGYNHEVLIPGILEKFDLTQVYQSLYPRPLTVLNPFRGDKTYVSAGEIIEVDRAVSETYHGLKNINFRGIKKAGEVKRTELIIKGLTL